MNEPIAYLWGRDEDRYTEWLGWTSGKEAAEVNANSQVERYVFGAVMALHEDGSVGQIEWHQHRPEPYRGPVVQAFINSNQPGRFHRVPVDCVTIWSAGGNNYELTEDHPYRFIQTSEAATFDECMALPWDRCRCGEWQLIEGAPDKVAELVAKFPPPATKEQP
ncbi:MAG: hypothetical protein EBR82_47020 [Caulobacteraceae bacterium]|nr:hypothetical protein [Caulobacteraceae bacterium]